MNHLRTVRLLDCAAVGPPQQCFDECRDSIRGLCAREVPSSLKIDTSGDCANAGDARLSTRTATNARLFVPVARGNRCRSGMLHVIAKHQRCSPLDRSLRWGTPRVNESEHDMRRAHERISGPPNLDEADPIRGEYLHPTARRRRLPASPTGTARWSTRCRN